MAVVKIGIKDSVFRAGEIAHLVLGKLLLMKVTQLVNLLLFSEF